MRCTRCPATKNLRKVQPFGLLCYSCFEKITDKMIEYRENWFGDTILPQIKGEIINNIRASPDFNLDEFIGTSGHDAEMVEFAIEEMLFYETLPEDIRGFLHNYRGYEMDISGDEDDKV